MCVVVGIQQHFIPCCAFILEGHFKCWRSTTRKKLKLGSCVCHVLATGAMLKWGRQKGIRIKSYLLLCAPAGTTLADGGGANGSLSLSLLGTDRDIHCRERAHPKKKNRHAIYADVRARKQPRAEWHTRRTAGTPVQQGETRRETENRRGTPWRRSRAC